IFTNTEEQAFVALVDEQNGVFTAANLQLVAELTQKLERISFADSSDLDKLESLAKGDAHAREIVAAIAPDGITLEDSDRLKQLAVYGEQSGLFNPRGIAAVKHILVKAQPV